MTCDDILYDCEAGAVTTTFHRPALDQAYRAGGDSRPSVAASGERRAPDFRRRMA